MHEILLPIKNYKVTATVFSFNYIVVNLRINCFSISSGNQIKLQIQEMRL